MTDTLRRPTPLSRVWSGSKIIAEDLQGDDLSDVLELHSDASAWWVLARSDAAAGPQLRAAAAALDLDDLAVDDLLAEDRRAKYEQVGQSRLVITGAAELHAAAVELEIRPISLVVTDRALICLVEPDLRGFNPAVLLSRRAEQLADGGVEVALQAILAAVVAGYADVVEWLEDATDQLADALFEERPLSDAEHLHAFRLRSLLSQLRRLTDPMRRVLDELAEDQPPDSLAGRRWTVLHEQHSRVANAADSLRDSLASIFDTSLALADVRTNTIMKQLSAWAAVLAVPTVITGFVGMNVAFPLAQTGAGFWFYFLVMLVMSAGVYLIFRRKGWL